MPSLFRARFDVVQIQDVTIGVWELSGNIVDMTGSFNAGDVSVDDRIIMRGYGVGGYTVFDRVVVTSIIGCNATDITLQVQNDQLGNLLSAAGRPSGGSFPIGSSMWYDKITNKASFYQSQFDPDYDAAIDNLNLMELQYVLRSLSCNAIQGGHHCYATIDERDNLAVPLRMWGMMVSVFNDPSNPFLNGNYELLYGKHNTDISNNQNWRRLDKTVIEISNQTSGTILGSEHRLDVPNPQFYLLSGGQYKAAQVSYTVNIMGDITWNSINPISGFLVLV